MNDNPKIAIIGNMNNNSVNLAMYLYDYGFNITLLLFSNEDPLIFKPSSDFSAELPFPITRLTWGRYRDLFNPLLAKVITRDLAPFNFLIGSRLSPAFLERFTNRYLDAFIPTGGDIWTVPHLTLTLKGVLKFLFSSYLQRRGIRNSRRVFFDTTNREIEDRIAGLIPLHKRSQLPIVALYAPLFEDESLHSLLHSSALSEKFASIKRNCDIFLVHHVKHLWTPHSVRYVDKYQAKGNDKVLKALKIVRQSHPHLNVKVLMTEYGPDFRETQRFAKLLKVDDMIEWFPVLPRKELMCAIYHSDAVIGEITRSWLSYGVVIEAMVSYKPIIHNRLDSFFSPNQLYPMYNASNEYELSAAIHSIYTNPVKACQTGLAAGQWYRQSVIQYIQELSLLFSNG